MKIIDERIMRYMPEPVTHEDIYRMMDNHMRDVERCRCPQCGNSIYFQEFSVDKYNKEELDYMIKALNEMMNKMMGDAIDLFGVNPSMIILAHKFKALRDEFMNPKPNLTLVKKEED